MSGPQHTSVFWISFFLPLDRQTELWRSGRVDLSCRGEGRERVRKEVSHTRTARMCHNTLFVNANLARETLYIRKHLGGSQPLDSGIYPVERKTPSFRAGI